MPVSALRALRSSAARRPRWGGICRHPLTLLCSAAPAAERRTTEHVELQLRGGGRRLVPSALSVEPAGPGSLSHAERLHREIWRRTTLHCDGGELTLVQCASTLSTFQHRTGRMEVGRSQPCGACDCSRIYSAYKSIHPHDHGNRFVFFSFFLSFSCFFLSFSLSFLSFSSCCFCFFFPLRLLFRECGYARAYVSACLLASSSSPSASAHCHRQELPRSRQCGGCALVRGTVVAGPTAAGPGGSGLEPDTRHTSRGTRRQCWNTRSVSPQTNKRAEYFYLHAVVDHRGGVESRRVRDMHAIGASDARERETAPATPRCMLIQLRRDPRRLLRRCARSRSRSRPGCVGSPFRCRRRTHAWRLSCRPSDHSSRPASSRRLPRARRFAHAEPLAPSGRLGAHPTSSFMYAARDPFLACMDHCLTTTVSCAPRILRTALSMHAHLAGRAVRGLSSLSFSKLPAVAMNRTHLHARTHGVRGRTDGRTDGSNPPGASGYATPDRPDPQRGCVEKSFHLLTHVRQTLSN